MIRNRWLLMLCLIFVIHLMFVPEVLSAIETDCETQVEQIMSAPPSFEKKMSEPDLRKFVLDWLKKYDPDGFEIVTAYEALPLKFRLSDGSEVTIGAKDKMSNYFTERTIIDVLENIGTLVHEYNHYYTRQMIYTLPSKYPMKMDDEYYYYFIDKSNKIAVKYSPVVPASASADMIPENLRKERYDLYIKGNTSTQSDGVFALLDEMNSYRLDMQTYLSVYDYLKDIGSNDPENWLMFFSNIQNLRVALYEFRYFILSSMSYMAKHRGQQYQAVFENRPFLEAYALINREFEMLDVRYDSLKSAILSHFDSIGIDTEVDGDYTYIGDTGIKNYDKYRNKLILALQNSELKALHEAMLRQSGK